MTNLDELIATANKLRAPGGCPWDAEQTHQSLTKYLIEESYELVEAIESMKIWSKSTSIRLILPVSLLMHLNLVNASR